MTFSLGIGDILLLLNLCKSVYDTLKGAPAEYRECQSELKSIAYAVDSLLHDAEDPKSLLNRNGASRKEDLLGILKNCAEVIQQLQTIIAEHSSLTEAGKGKVVRMWNTYQFGSTDLASIRGKLNFHLLSINTFLISLESSSIGRIERKLDRIYGRLVRETSQNYQSQASSPSIVSTRSSLILSEINTREDDAWQELKDELLAEDICLPQIIAHRKEIIDYVKSLIASDPLAEATTALSGGVRTILDNIPDVHLEALLQQPKRTVVNERPRGLDLLKPGIRELGREKDLSRHNFIRLPRSASSHELPGSNFQDTPLCRSPELPGVRLPSTISHEPPKTIQSWSKGESKIEVSVTMLEHGKYRNQGSCFLALDIYFWAPPSPQDRLGSQRFIQGKVDCIVENNDRFVPSITEAFPRNIVGTGVTNDIYNTNARSDE